MYDQVISPERTQVLHTAAQLHHHYDTDIFCGVLLVLYTYSVMLQRVERFAVVPYAQNDFISFCQYAQVDIVLFFFVSRQRSHAE